MQVMICAEADAYWCLCKLLDGIQDHYTHAQPGIQRTVFRLEELVRSVCGCHAGYASQEHLCIYTGRDGVHHPIASPAHRALCGLSNS